mgnify:CR=1 FL=1
MSFAVETYYLSVVGEMVCDVLHVEATVGQVALACCAADSLARSANFVSLSLAPAKFPDFLFEATRCAELFRRGAAEVA